MYGDQSGEFVCETWALMTFELEHASYLIALPPPLPSYLLCGFVLDLSVTVGVIEKLGIGVVPYVVLLVVPVLGRMSDQCEDVRLMATYSFATLIRLMPLEVMIYVTPFSPQDFPCCSYLQLD